MHNPTLRWQVAVLWVVVAVAMGSMILMYVAVEPGGLQEALDGQMMGTPLDTSAGVLIALETVIPLMMATLTVLADTRAVRYANVVVGLLIGAFMGYYGVVISFDSEFVFAGYWLPCLLAGLIAFLIAGLSAAVLRRPARQTAAPVAEPSRPRQDATV